MKNRVFRALCALVLTICLLTPAFALGAARYPERVGTVTDDAGVLGQTLLKDIASFAEKCEDEADVRLNVALVSFLDGEDAQSYASHLFQRWELGENDLLVLGAAGEDSFAVALGANVSGKWSESAANSLLFSSGFSEQFKEQQYDAAFGRFFIAFDEVLSKRFDAEVKLGQLFADYQPQAQPTAVPTATPVPQDAGNALWDSMMDSIKNNVNDYNDYHERRASEPDEGLTPGGWIVLVVIILIIFSQSDPARKRRGGCGCGPLGWIFAALGLGQLFGGERRGPHGPRGPRGPHGRW
ncbi:MAG: TPM domain-containing protein [Eubacteriales bacterium]|nr:TPM domain-containing protein [Eubacteriales bacterium]